MLLLTMADLTERQRKFADEYILDGNATRAALRAGYAESAAQQMGSWLLCDERVRARVRKHQSVQEAAASVTHERILAELARVAFSDVRTLFSESGSLRAPTELDDHAAASVSGIEVRQVRTTPVVMTTPVVTESGVGADVGASSPATAKGVLVPASGADSSPDTRTPEYVPAVQVEQVAKIKLWDKVRALELLAKHTRILGPEGDGLASRMLASHASAPVDTSTLSDEELEQAIALAERMQRKS